MHSKQRCLEIFEQLNELYPNVKTFLQHNNTFELLIAVILSAQCTDERVNLTTPTLFKTFPTPALLAKGPLEKIKECINSINFFNNKAKNIQKTSEILVKNYNSQVPKKLSELVTLPGVGRKTANVVLGQAFDIPGITVDTHVKRVSTRLGFCKKTDPVKIEQELMKLWPKDTWNTFSTTMILHGRNTCKALTPLCSTCSINKTCKRIGVKKFK